MRTGIVITLAGVLALNASAVGAATAGVSPSVRKDISLSYVATDKAFHSKNETRLFYYLMPGYVVYKHGKDVSVGVTRQSQAQFFAGADAVTSRTVVHKITMQGRTAVATVTQYVTVTMSDTKQRRTHRDGYLLQQQDFWMRMPLGWRIRDTHILSEVETVDGKPVGNDHR